jgi:mannosyltransferase OCH1-like enzyme
LSSPIPLVQFWHAADPPAEVAELLATWEADPAFAYRRYDLPAATELIAEHFDERLRSAFAACAVPAMQADVFRYAALFVHGGLYLDADTSNGGGLSALLENASRGLLMDRRGKIANDVLYFRRSKDPLLKYVLGCAVDNIERRISNNVWEVTGPGIMTKLHRSSSPEAAALFDGFRIESHLVIREAVIPKWSMQYKETADDWRRGDVSIFRDG